MKKLLVVVFLIVSMTGVAHADQAAASAAYQSCMATCAGPVNGVACGDQCTAAYNAQGGANPATVSQQQHGSGAPSGFTALAPIPGLTDANTTSVINSTTLANFFNNLYKYLIGLAAVIAVIEIIWGGLEISTKDSVSKQSDGKERITQAIFGLVLVLSPVLVFSIINPSILNLSLNLPPINLTPPVSSGASDGTAGTSGTDSATGCTVSGVSGILQVAVCPSAAAAQAWGQNCSGNLSTITALTKTTAGAATSFVTCAGMKSYVFIDTGNPYSFTEASAVVRLEPLAITTSNTDNANSAILFSNICQSANLGLQTCISDTPLYTLSVPCLPAPTTQMPASASGKCYNETLSCEINSTVSPLCSSSPGWTPFQ